MQIVKFTQYTLMMNGQMQNLMRKFSSSSKSFHFEDSRDKQFEQIYYNTTHYDVDDVDR